MTGRTAEEGHWGQKITGGTFAASPPFTRVRVAVAVGDEIGEIGESRDVANPARFQVTAYLVYIKERMQLVVH